MEKAPDAFRTISEVAEDLDLPQHVLRFWETRFGQIKPLKRGGGRRYYRPDDVDLLRGIRQYLYGEGYTIKGVQRIIRERGVRSVMEVGRSVGGDYVPEVAIIPSAEEVHRERANEWPQASSSEPFSPLHYADESDDAGFDDLSEPPEPAMTAIPQTMPAAGPEPRLQRETVSDDQRSILAEALKDLAECRRLLDGAR